ncbi:MAG: molybdopterin-guanine dinucleotide biosynthesis protein B [Actinomycetota bacterium]
MVPIVSVVGKSHSGKTTLIEKLIPELKRRGYKIATIKHDVHDFDIDHPGKDSWRHAQAGADTVVISSPHKVAVIKKVDWELSLDEISGKFAGDTDLIITEGYKREDKPKIEVYRSHQGELLCSSQELLAVVETELPSSPAPELYKGVPHFDMDDVKGLADLIERELLMGSSR